MLKYRLLSGPVMILVGLVACGLDQYIGPIPAPSWVGTRFWHDGSFPPGMIMGAVMLVLVPWAGRELAKIFKAAGAECASARVIGFGGVVGILVSYLVPWEPDHGESSAIVATAAVGVLAVALLFHVRGQKTHGAALAAGAALFSFVYLGLMFGFILAIRRDYDSAYVALVVILVTKSCDIGAYSVGRAIGRHKLIPWLSPGKTWEGLFGGICTAAGVAVLAWWIGRKTGGDGGHIEGMSAIMAAGFGGLFALVGQAGDLLASLLKRDARLKDSGASVPGFGGVLDVLDSIILTAPVAYWMLRVAQG